VTKIPIKCQGKSEKPVAGETETFGRTTSYRRAPIAKHAKAREGNLLLKETSDGRRKKNAVLERVVTTLTKLLHPATVQKSTNQKDSKKKKQKKGPLDVFK